MNNSKLKKLLKNPYVFIGGIIMGLILLMIIVGFFWMPYEPTKMSASEKLQGISLRHIMGTDNMGRDVFSRVMYGSRVTLMIAIGTIRSRCWHYHWLNHRLLRWNDRRGHNESY